MPARHICRACRRTLWAESHIHRQNFASLSSTSSTAGRKAQASNAWGHPLRPISTTTTVLKASTAPQPYKPKSAATTPPAPESTPLSQEEDQIPSGAQPTSITSTAQNIAKNLRTHLPKTTETYIAYGGCEKLLKECAVQAEYQIPQASEKGAEIPKTKDGQQLGVGSGWWYETLGLPPTFNTWAQVTFLHMYLLTVRIRCFPTAAVTPWHQHLIDHFSNLAEDKMIATHKIDMRALRSRYLKDLFDQWRGIQAGYDEGLVKGDAVLATAVWRNIFRADPDVDLRGVGEVVSYMRHVMGMLQDMSDEDIASGDIAFGANPGSERDVVRVRSKMMDSKAG